MKRRLLALFLAALMIFGMVPTFSLAAEAEATPETLRHFSTRYSALAIDGMIGADESYFLTSAMTDGETTRPFASVWDWYALYFAVQVQPEDTRIDMTVNGIPFSVTMADGALTVSGIHNAVAVAGDVWEIMVPHKSVGVYLAQYDQVIGDASLSVGDCAWEGEICLSSEIRHRNTGFGGAVIGNANHLSFETDGSTTRFLLQPHATDTNYSATYRAYAAENGGSQLYPADSLNVMEFDFVADAMPEFDTWNALSLSDITVVNGLCIGVIYDWSTGDTYTVGITNLKDLGLSLVVRTSDAANNNGIAFPLGVELGDLAHIRLEYNATEDTLAAYSNDAYLGKASDLKDLAWSTGRKWIMLNLMTAGFTPDSAEKTMDFTVSNVTTGVTLIQPDRLAAITFESIKGENTAADNITSNLILPSVVSDSVLSDVALEWTSSNPAVIAADGTVTPAAIDKKVTLTVALKGAPDVQKSFELRVPADGEVERIHFATKTLSVTVNGSMAAAEFYAFAADTEGDAPRAFTSVWDKENLYFAIRPQADDTSASIVINGKEVKLTLIDGVLAVSGVEGVAAAAGSIWEVKIPKAAVDVYPAGYDTEVGDLQVTVGDSEWSGKLAIATYYRQKVTDAAGYSPIESSDPTTAFGVASEDGQSLNFQLVYDETKTYASSYGAYLYAWGMPVRAVALPDGSNIVEFDLLVDSLPEVDGWFADGSNIVATGLNGAVCFDERFGYAYAYAIVNLKDQGLTMVVRSGDESNNYGVAVPLGIEMDEQARIRLEYIPGTKDLAIYVNSIRVGTVPALFVIHVSGSYSSGLLGFSLQTKNFIPTCVEDAINVTVSNVTNGGTHYEKADFLSGITFDTIKGENTAADNITGNLTLPTVISDSILGNVALVWTSSDPAVIAADGTVTPAITARTVTLTVALKGDPENTKSFVLTVPAGDVERTFFSTWSYPSTILNGRNDAGDYYTMTAQMTDGETVRPFASVWDKNYIYFAVEAQPEDTELTIDILGNVATITKSGSDLTVTGIEGASAMAADLWEIRLPLKAMGIYLAVLDQEVDGLTIAMGDCSWDGKLALTTSYRQGVTLAAPYTYTASQNPDVLFGSISEDGESINLQLVYDEAAAYQEKDHASVIAWGLPGRAVALPDGYNVMEFELVIDEMPAFDGWLTNMNEPHVVVNGLNGCVVFDERFAYSYAYGITNLEGQGLSLVVRNNDADSGYGAALPLGVELGETARIRLEYYPATRTLQAWCNNICLGTVDAPYIVRVNGSYASGLAGFELYTRGFAPASAADEMDITLRNAASGATVAVRSNVLDSITIDTIKGTNADAANIMSDLTLPATVADSYLGNVELVWTSSDEAVITNEGKVIPVPAATTVTLTVAPKGDPENTKSFELTVVVKDYLHFVTKTLGVTVDGTMQPAEFYAFAADTEGDAPRAFTSVWDKENLYFAIRPQAGDTAASIVINGKEVQLTLTNGVLSASGVEGAAAAAGSIWEVKIPKASVDVYPSGYDTIVGDMKLTVGDSEWSGRLIIATYYRQKVTDAAGYSPIESSDPSTAFGVVSEDGQTLTFQLVYDETKTYASSYGAYLYAWGMPARAVSLPDGSNIVEFDLLVDSLPEVDSWFADGSNIVATGLNGAVCFDERFGYSFAYAIVNLKDQGLTMVVRSGDASNDYGVAVPLGIGMDEQARIRLEYIPGTKDLAIYVNSIRVGTVPALFVVHVNGSYSSGLLGFSLQTRNFIPTCAEDAIHVTVSNVTNGSTHYEKKDFLADITFDTIKGGNTAADGIFTTMYLPAAVSDSILGNIDLVWTSSNPSVISTTGVVSPISEAVEVTLTVALKGDPERTKSFAVTVLPADPIHFASRVDTVKVDGKAYESGWWFSGEMSGEDTFRDFDALWDNTHLYLLVRANESDETLTAVINGVTITVQADGTVTGADGATAVMDTYWEIGIPRSTLGITMKQFEDTVPMSLSMSGCSWSGDLCFTSATRYDIGAVIASTNTENIGTNADGEHMNFWYKYDESVTSYQNTYVAYQHTWNAPNMDIRFGGRNVMEFDFRADKMPAFDTWNDDVLVLVNGLIMGVMYDWAGGSGWSYTAGITNLKSTGLTLVVRTHDEANGNVAVLPLGVEMHETAHIRLEYSSDERALYAYCNDKFLGKAENLQHVCWTTSKRLLMFNLYTQNYPPVSPSCDMDFTVSNVTTGAMSVGSIIEAVTFDTFRGKNVSEDAITRNLLMTDVVDHPIFGGIEVTWSSSNEAVISKTGKLGTVTEPTNVTITATLTQDPTKTKTFNLTVLPCTIPTEQASPARINAAFAADTVVLDGLISEEGWLLNTKVLDDAGVLTGEFGVQWDEENLYLAVDQSAGTVTALTVNGVDVLGADSAAGSITKEYRIPLADLGITADRYDIEMPISITVENGTYEGTVVLTATDWWAADTHYYPLSAVYATGAGLGGNPTDAQGIEKLSNGFRMYDLYEEGGENPMGVRSYIAYMGTANYPKFNDRSETMFVQFDFQANALPVYDEVTSYVQSSGYANYGFSCGLSDSANAVKCSNVVLFGIYNSADGLVFVARDSGIRSVKLNKQVGDLFRVGIAWETDGDVILYIDGEEFATFPKLSAYIGSVGNCSFLYNLYRNTDAPASEADNMDILLTNVAFGKRHDAPVLDSLTFDDFRGTNTSADAVSFDLQLPSVITNDQASFTAESVTWTSSNPDVIDAATGKVTRPATGAVVVNLTATTAAGASKTFILIVKGLSVSNSMVLVANNDRSPYCTPGTASSALLYTLDENNNGVVLDLGESKTINVVTLTDTDEIARLSTQSLTLWISDDNANFTSVENFKLLHQGTQWYLYGFEATGQYVKVHYTHFDFANTSFTGVLSEMITADYEEHFGISGAVEETALMIANNADYAWQDQAVVLPDITGHAGTRVYLNGELLYHFVENGKVIARIPDLAAGASEELTVVTGSEDSMDISNKDAVYEVSYGTVETHRYVGGRQILSLSKGMKFPDGSVLEQDTLFAMYGNNFRVSYDGGYVWSDYAATVANPGIDTYTGTTGTAVPGDWYHGDGGWIVDWQTGRLIYQCHYLQGGYNASNILESNIRQRFIYSDDGGKTWNKGYEMPRIPEVDPQSSYCHSYSDGVMVQSYDGFGPNVDFVFDLGCQYDNNGAFCARVAYSCDAGQTWTYSTSLITFGEAAGVEGGLSECGIIERDDGVLVLYARCQFVEAIRLAKAYSYDHGITWTKAVESNIYSPNTQPILMRTDMDLDGTRETPMIFWSGNNALGGGSYRRGPVTAAKFTEDLENITDITNLFFGTPLETYTQEASCIATNPCVQQVGEDLVVTISRLNHGDSVNLIVEDFLNKFNRNKGAYDSFEGGNAEYEGWETSMGAVSVTDAAATDGSLSMVVEGGAKAVRSIPYMTDGTLSMDLYLTGSERFTLELQNAYTDKCNVTAPVGFSVAGGQLTPYGTGASIALQSGWNTVCFDVALIDGTAKLTVNGSTVTIPVNTAVEKYLCYIALNTENTVLVDNVLVQEDSAVTFSEEPETLEIAGTTMTLGNDLSLNFLIEVADVTGSGLYAEIVHGDKVFTIPQSEWVTSGNYIRIAYTGLAAKQMTDDVVITICDANGNKLASKTDSVRAYAMRMFGKSGDDFDTVLADMLNYGAAAQLQFNYKSDDLANSLMTEEQQAKATASIELANIRETAAGYQGTTLGLENNIVLNFFYSADFVGKTATVSYTDHYGVVHEYDVEVAASGNMGKVSVDELVISDCSIAITVTIDGQSVVDSVESYCARMTTLALGEPLMKFAASARTYFSK